MIKEFEIGMNALSLDTLMFEWSDTVKLGYYEYLTVKADVDCHFKDVKRGRLYDEELDRVDIDLIAIDGKEIVSISQEFEDEIKDKIIKEVE